MLAEAGIKETQSRACLGISKGNENSLKERWHTALRARTKNGNVRNTLRRDAVIFGINSRSKPDHSRITCKLIHDNRN